MKYLICIVILSFFVACKNDKDSQQPDLANNITDIDNFTIEKIVPKEINYDTVIIEKLTSIRTDSFFMKLMNHYMVSKDGKKVESLWQHIKKNNIKIPELYVGYASFINENKTKNDEAIAIYKEAIALRPTYALPYKIIGNIYIHYNMMQDALDYLNKAHEYDPKDIEVVNNIANIYFVKKQYDVAVSYYSKAIEIAPNRIVYTNRALCYDQLKQPQLANQDRISAEAYQ